MPGILLHDDEEKKSRLKFLKGKNKWLIYIAGGGIVVIVIAMIILSMGAPDIGSFLFPPPTPTPTPPPDILSLKVGVDVVQNPYAHGQNVIRIVHIRGPTIKDISTLYFLPISPTSFMQSRAIPKVSSNLAGSSFGPGAIVYLYPTSTGYEVSKELPNYTDSIDFAGGRWSVSLMDSKTKYGLGDYPVEVSSSKTHFADGTISSIISSTNEYDTIIATGTLYKERPVITKPLRIISKIKSVIDGGGIGTVISVQANDVEISGFDVQNSGSSDGGITVYRGFTGANIHDNYVHKCYVGIWLNGAANSFVNYNTAYENDMDGIRIDNGAVQNTIMGNIVRDNENDGIYVIGSDYNKITENVASGNTNVGIEIINYEQFHNICEYNTGTDVFQCSAAIDRTKPVKVRPTIMEEE